LIYHNNYASAEETAYVLVLTILPPPHVLCINEGRYLQYNFVIFKNVSASSFNQNIIEQVLAPPNLHWDQSKVQIKSETHTQYVHPLYPIFV